MVGRVEINVSDGSIILVLPYISIQPHMSNLFLDFYKFKRRSKNKKGTTSFFFPSSLFLSLSSLFYVKNPIFCHILFFPY